tara:strand:+ start:39 stop:158 length:120 start_codon:yes stop_codon:yes gene_type:complete
MNKERGSDRRQSVRRTDQQETATDKRTGDERRVNKDRRS